MAVNPRSRRLPVVAVLDGGVDLPHPDLDGAMWTNPGETAGDGVDNDGNGYVDDLHGFNAGFATGESDFGLNRWHGTGIAGVIAAEDNGFGATGVAAGRAQVLSIGGLYDNDDSGLINFRRAVDYLVELKGRGENVRVMNVSWGVTTRSREEQAEWKRLVQKLLEANILLVAAVSNEPLRDLNSVPLYPQKVDLPNVVVVASTNKRGDRLAFGSSRGDRIVDLATFGQDLFTTSVDGAYAKRTGNSFAAPRVAAAAALMFEANPALSAVRAAELLLATVEPVRGLRGRVRTGGALDIERAVAAARAEVSGL
jgi:subtilisin family serine protease